MSLALELREKWGLIGYSRLHRILEEHKCVNHGRKIVSLIISGKLF